MRVSPPDRARSAAEGSLRLLFVFKSAGYMRHFAETIRLLLQRGHTVRVKLGSKSDAREYFDALDALQCTYEGFSYDLIRKRNTLWLRALSYVREARDYVRYLDPRFREADILRERAQEYAPAMVRALGQCGFFNGPRVRGVVERFLERLERFAPVNPQALAVIRAERPDVIVLSPLVDFASWQVDYVKAARALRIPSVVGVASWDNLSNKGQMGLVPDFVTVWNDMQRDEAVLLHGARREQVIVTGAQTFDHWFEWQPSTTATEFRRQRGLSPEGPLLLYLCSSKSIASDEVSFVREWIHWIRHAGHPSIRDAAIAIRPHPKHIEQWRPFDEKDYSNVAVFPRSATFLETPAARSEFFDTLFHSDAIVGLNTTALIEAAILGRPVLVPVVSGLRQTQRGTVGTLHFQYLADEEAGLVVIGRSPQEHLRQLAGTIGDPAVARARARNFVQRFVRPHGLESTAGTHVVQAFESMRGAPTTPLPSASAALFIHRAVLWLIGFATYSFYTEGRSGLRKTAVKLSKQAILAGRSVVRGGGLVRKGVRKAWRRTQREARHAVSYVRGHSSKMLRRAVRFGRALWRRIYVIKRHWKDLVHACRKLHGRVVKDTRRRHNIIGGHLRRTWQLIRAVPRTTKRVQLEDMYYLARLGRWRLLIVDVRTTQYGHAGYEILFGLELARKVGAAVYLLKPKRPANAALFELASDHVHVIKRDPLRDWAGRRTVSLWWIVRSARRLRGMSHAGRLTDGRKIIVSGHRPAEVSGPSYLRRNVIRDAMRARLRSDHAAQAERAACELGIDPGAALVCLHVREPGTKEGRNAEDKGSKRIDATRNARLETYFQAVDWLVSQGFTVVRIGDPFVTPLTRPGVVDLASAPSRTGILELYLLARARFLLGSESGPYHVSYLFGTPTLIANATDPIGGYPIRPRDLYILKRARRRDTSEVLSLADMLTDAYYWHFRDVEYYEYLDNTSSEITAAVQEMTAGTQRVQHPSPVQQQYAAMAATAAFGLRGRFPYVRKWGPDHRFLGEGWIGRDFAEHYLYDGAGAGSVRLSVL